MPQGNNDGSFDPTFGQFGGSQPAQPVQPEPPEMVSLGVPSDSAPSEVPVAAPERPVGQPAAPVRNDEDDDNDEPRTPPAVAAPVMPRAAAQEVQNIEIPDVKDASIGGLQLSEEALATKKILAKEPRLPFIIPLDPGEKPGAWRSVTINTYRMQITKGVLVYVPQSIWQQLADAYSVPQIALNNHPNNLALADEEKRRALRG